MIIVKSDQGTAYEAKNHFHMWGVRKLGFPEGAQNVILSISEFLPDGGAVMSSSDKERIYYVLRGSITVRDEHGEEHIINESDMIYISPNEKREMVVNGLVAARVLVIIVNV